MQHKERFSLTHIGPTAPPRPWRFSASSMEAAIWYYCEIHRSAPFVIILVSSRDAGQTTEHPRGLATTLMARFVTFWRTVRIVTGEEMLDLLQEER